MATKAHSILALFGRPINFEEFDLLQGRRSRETNKKLADAERKGERVCNFPGCTTILSIHNDGKQCFRHQRITTRRLLKETSEQAAGCQPQELMKKIIAVSKKLGIPVTGTLPTGERNLLSS